MIERLLLAGHGSIGKRHLRIARETLPDADIRVLCHRPAIETPEYADGCFSRLEDALAFGPQAAIIANPAPFHMHTATALAGMRCHMLVEKPLADSLTGVADLLALVRKRHCILQVAYNLRFLPSLVEFRARISSGAIGRVLSVRCEIGQYLPSWRPDTDYRVSVSARKDLGGGVLLELSHELDYLRWLFGEVVWVNAWLGRQSALVIDVEDTAHLIMGFAPQADGTTSVATLDMDFIRHDTVRMCTAIGEQGSLRWNGVTGEIDEYSAGSAAWRGVFHHPHKWDDSYRAQWRRFLDCVESGLRPLVGGTDGLAVLGMVDAARRSAQAQGERIYIANMTTGIES